MANPQSPIEIFAKSLDIHSKPGDAIHKALEGIDGNQLTAFMTNLSDRIATNLGRSGPPSSFGPGRSDASPGTILGDALKSTNANAEFARKIQVAFKAAEVTAEQGLPSNMAGIAPETLEQTKRYLHYFASSVDNAVDGYVSSLEGPGAQAGPNGQRRHFNKAQLTEAQHIAAGTTSVAKIKDVQRELKAEGFDVGKFGKHHDGVDGKAGQHTLGAMAQAMKKLGMPSSP